jgi:hypothetical protein
VETADAPAKVIIGPHEDPFDGEAYTKGELQDAFGFCQLVPSDEDSFAVFQSKGVGDPPNKSGGITMSLVRQVRDSEFNATGGRQDVYLFFLDRTDAIVESLLTTLQDEWWYERIRRVRGPAFNPRANWGSQGRYMWVEFLIEWATESQQ